MKKRNKIIICILSIMTILSTFALSVFADSIGTSESDGTNYSIANSITVDMAYSRGFMGDSTWGYFSLDTTPILANGTLTDNITMTRTIHNTDGTVENRPYQLSCTIRRSSRNGNIMVTAHSIGSNLDGNQLSKLDLLMTKNFAIDLNHSYNNMPIASLAVPSGQISNTNGLTPNIEFKYRDSNNVVRTYRGDNYFTNDFTDGSVVYLQVPIIHDDVIEYLETSIEGVRSFEVNGQKLLDIWDVKYSYSWDRSYPNVTNLNTEVYSYFLNQEITYTYESGDVYIVPQTYFNVNTQNKAYIDGQNSDIDIGWLDFIITGAEGVLNTPLIGQFCLADLLITFISLSVFIAFLKIFAGG